MANQAQKISDLTQTTGLSSSDRLVVLVNPSSTANVKTISLANFGNTFISQNVSNSAPQLATSPGNPGNIAYDTAHFYVCVAANTWVRTALSTW